MAIPEKIGKYEISEQIGVGGFGAVFKGRDPFIKRTVAVKTCQLNDPEIKSRFFREAELAGNLHHRNITTIYDFGVENDTPYIVQEFLTGEDLDKVIKRGETMPLQRKLEILIAITEGLHFAHEAHVIHRDIKPANIRILENGAVKIMDFGIAKSLQSESSLTQTGITLGTSAYLAPEQIRGETLDRRTDVFAIGVLAYELLAYQKPFRGEHLSTILYRILNEAPAPVESLAGDVPPALAAVVGRAIEKNIQNRYPSMEAMRQDLIAVYRQVVGGSGGFSTAAAAAQAPGGPPMPFDPEETIKEPSKGSPTVSHITPPSGALARAPEPDDPTVISDSLPRPMAAHAPAGLELVNFRDPSQRTGEAKAPDAAVASAAAAASGRNVWIGAGLAAALVIAAGVFLLMRTRSATPATTAPPAQSAAPAATAPIVFPAPQVGKDAVKDTAGKPAPVAPGKAAAAPAPPPKVEKVEKAEEKAASKKPEAAKPEPKPKSFKVQFSSIPMATLYVDGKKIGPSLPAQVIELPQGKHSLRFENPDLPPYEKQFAVGADGVPPIAYRFPVGAIVINAPAWAGANVLIDSKFKGILVGEKSFQVTAGPHKVTLSREGVNPHTEEVTVSEGAKKTLAPPAPTSTKESS